jgi:hypothetical protein
LCLSYHELPYGSLNLSQLRLHGNPGWVWGPLAASELQRGLPALEYLDDLKVTGLLGRSMLKEAEEEGEGEEEEEMLDPDSKTMVTQNVPLEEQPSMSKAIEVLNTGSTVTPASYGGSTNMGQQEIDAWHSDALKEIGRMERLITRDFFDGAFEKNLSVMRREREPRKRDPEVERSIGVMHRRLQEAVRNSYDIGRYTTNPNI